MSREHIQNATRKSFIVDITTPIGQNVPIMSGSTESQIVQATASETVESIGITDTDTALSNNPLGGAATVILYGPVKTIRMKTPGEIGKRVVKDSTYPGFFKEAPAVLTTGTVRWVFSEGILLEASTASGGTVINEVSFMYSPLWLPVAP